MAYMKKAAGKSMKMSSKMDAKGAGKEMSFMDKMKAAKAKKKK